MMPRMVSALVASLASTTAYAGPASVVPSAADVGDPLDFHARVEYGYAVERASIERESVGPGADPLGATPQQLDLAFEQFRHTITPRGELGVYRDTWLSVALPIVIAQSRELSLQDGVDRDSSSTLRDGILPFDGFDARDPGTALPGDLVFRGASRSGLDQVHLGLGIAPMNQQRDATKPTWKLGAELRLAVGKVMRFDAMRTDDQTGVSRGVHELRLWTSMARRYRRTEAWFEMYWQAPIAAKDGSLFEDPTNGDFGATNTMPGQRAGIGFGIEAYIVDDAINNNRISVDLGMKVDAHFEGRDYTEMWEVFALAGDSRGTGPLILDEDPTQPDVQAFSHPGITNVENYLAMTGRAAIRGQLGQHVRVAATLDLVWKTDHVITFADAGVDLPTCGSASGRCEDDVNDLVNPGTREVNPLHVPLIDLVGHRYHSEDNFGFVIGVDGQVLF